MMRHRASAGKTAMAQCARMMTSTLWGADAAEPLTQAIAAVIHCLHFLHYGFVPEPAFRAKRAQSCAGNPLSVL